jgi:hypothetical protein
MTLCVNLLSLFASLNATVMPPGGFCQLQASLPNTAEDIVPKSMRAA